MSPLQQYLNSIALRIDSEVQQYVRENPHADPAYVREGIVDEYAQGWCEDQQARKYGDYPYDGSLDDPMDSEPADRDVY